MTGQLDKANDIPTLTAAMTVEEIFAGVDIERRLSFLMQWTESDELGVVTLGLSNPVLLSRRHRRGGRKRDLYASRKATTTFLLSRSWVLSSTCGFVQNHSHAKNEAGLAAVQNMDFTESQARDLFLQRMQEADWKSPQIGPFGERVVDLAKWAKVENPILFCEYLHLGVAKDGLDPSWAEVALAIQWSLGETAQDQISAQYSALSEFPTAPIFLCHAREDKPSVHRYAAMLHHVGYSPWIDVSNLIAGQHWDVEIRRTIKRCFAFVVFISTRSHKSGYINDEIKEALEEVERLGVDKIFLIPAKLEDCSAPSHLAHLHWVDLHKRGFENLCRALRSKSKQQRSP